MGKNVFYEGLKFPVFRAETILSYCDDKEVLDIGCVEHNIDRTRADEWVHGRIKRAAKKVIGIDYLAEEVNKLKEAGYEVVCADATKPFHIGEQFDVIVVGNLIEHLSDFPGFFSNVTEHLKENGVVLVSTANPFYMEQYFYSAFKNEIMINPEHTCWLDPVALDQLAGRFGFRTEKVYWIKEGWTLSKVICNGESKYYDVLAGKWIIKKKGLMERVLAPVLHFPVKVLFPGKYEKMRAKYGKDLESMLYIRFIGALFYGFWSLYKRMIISAPINNHELYLSVLKRKEGGI